jgi:hypothetical protein
VQGVSEPAVPETAQPATARDRTLLPPDAFDVRVLSLHLRADTAYSYKVSYRGPGISRVLKTNINALDLMKFPGGSKAIDTYYNESLTKKPKKQNFKVLCFDPVLDTYTVSFVEAGKRKKTDKLMKASELLKLPGGTLAIEEYKALYTPNLPAKPVVKPKNLPAKSVHVLPINHPLSVSRYQAISDQYTVHYCEPGSTTILQRQVHAEQLKKFPGGPEAIEHYITTILPKLTVPVVPPPIDHPAVYTTFFIEVQPSTIS